MGKTLLGKIEKKEVEKSTAPIDARPLESPTVEKPPVKKKIARILLHKRHVDAFDANLSEEQRWAIFDRSQRFAWYEVARWINKEFGIPAPSRTAHYRFCNYMRKIAAARRYADAVAARTETKQLAKAAGSDGQTAAAFMALSQDLALAGNAKEAATFMQMALQLRRQAAIEKTNQLDREKFEATLRRLGEARATVGDDTVTPEARIKKMKEIFGIQES